MSRVFEQDAAMPPFASPIELNRLSEAVLGAAFEVHQVSGPGLLESWYERALQRELSLRNISSTAQILQPANYKGHSLGAAFRLDLLVENSLIIGIKAIEKLLPVHRAQLKTYLKLTGLPLGLILNFNETSLKNGIVCVVHHFPDR